MIDFVIHFYDEPQAQVQDVIDRLRQLYPTETRIFALGDGVPAMPLNGAEVTAFPQRVKKKGSAGHWTHRYLRFMLEHSTASHFIRLDPDTQPLKAVADLPEKDCVFCRVREVVIGAPVNPRLYRIPAGGAIGFTRGMAKLIVDKKYFLDPRFNNYAVYREYNDIMLRDIVHWHPDVVMIDRPDFCCGNRPLVEGASFFHK